MRRFSLIWLPILGALLACTGKVSKEWIEEVQLSDGSLIEIERTIVREGIGEPGHHGKVLEQRISYGTGGEKIVWPGNIDPLIFDRKDGRYYVVAVPGTVEECELYGHRDSLFVFYAFSNGKWTEVDKKEFPDGFRKNLLWNAWREEQPRRITLKEKRSRDLAMSARDLRDFDKSNTKGCREYG